MGKKRKAKRSSLSPDGHRKPLTSSGSGKAWFPIFVVCLRLALRSYSILNCTSPSNTGASLGGLLFDGKLSDSLLDSLMEASSPAGLCPPMQVPPPVLRARTVLVIIENEDCFNFLLGCR